MKPTRNMNAPLPEPRPTEAQKLDGIHLGCWIALALLLALFGGAAAVVFSLFRD